MCVATYTINKIAPVHVLGNLLTVDFVVLATLCSQANYQMMH